MVLTLRKTAPFFCEVLDAIGNVRFEYEKGCGGATKATIEVWFTPESWCDLLRAIPPEYGYISQFGENYGAVIGGAECFCVSRVPVNGRFQIRIRID